MISHRYRLDHHLESETLFVREALAGGGWQETTDDDWQLLWSNDLPEPGTYRALTPRQRVNHFPGIDPLIRKDELHANLAYASTTGRLDMTSARWSFPQSFAMPADHAAWRAVAATEPETTWIVKPDIGSMGRGISLIRHPHELVLEPGVSVQRYIDRPLLFPDHPYKHVLRVYALVTALDPLTAYIYPECVVKVTSERYEPPDQSYQRLAVHLTNPTVQIEHGGPVDPVKAIDMSTYAQRLTTVGVERAELWSRIREMLIDVFSVFAEPVKWISSVSTSQLDSCFELLGFDVLVDDGIRPWLLECNLSPSLEARSGNQSETGRAQRLAKVGVVTDTLRLIGAGLDRFDPRPIDERVCDEIDRRGRFEPLVVLGNPQL